MKTLLTKFYKQRSYIQFLISTFVCGLIFYIVFYHVLPKETIMLDRLFWCSLALGAVIGFLITLIITSMKASERFWNGLEVFKEKAHQSNVTKEILVSLQNEALAFFRHNAFGEIQQMAANNVLTTISTRLKYEFK